MSGSLPIAETFVSVQGEGRLTGTPSWFVRLSGCNLRCAWCDTPYASWKPEGQARSIESLIDEARGSGVGHAVVTGGEPMMFEGVADLCAALRRPREAGGAGMHVTVETAGTVFREVEADLMSISPKLANSTPSASLEAEIGVGWRERHESRRLNIEALGALLAAHPAPGRQLKFVVSREEDLAEIEALLALLPGGAPADVLLMPEGVDPAALEAKRGWVERACAARGWGFCRRLHIELFGNTRGT